MRRRDVRRGVTFCTLVATVMTTVGLPGGSPDNDQAPSAASPAAELKLTAVSPSVVMAEHRHGANLSCIALADGLVFVDTGLSTETAAAFRAMMEERFARPTQALFLTHAHIDHFFGMAAFDDVPVIAASAARKLFERQLAIDFDERAIQVYSGIFPSFGEIVGTAKPFLPTVWFDHEHLLGQDEGRLVMRNCGGHSPGSSYAYYAAEGALISGDLVQVDKYPYFGDPSTDLERWIDTLKQWHGTEATGICPGHGRAVDRSYLPQIWRYFEELTVTVGKLKADGVAIETAVSHPDLPRGYWPEQTQPGWWPMCIARLYQTL